MAKPTAAVDMQKQDDRMKAVKGRTLVQLTFAWGLLLGLALVLGCASEKESGRVSRPARSSNITIDEAESGFDPSHYNPSVARIDTLLERSWAKGQSQERPVALATETAGGFRVQVLMTKDIDEARRTRTALQSAAPSDSAYVIYEPPYYKVRAGNFRTRSEAAELMEILQQRGFPDAWVVPDEVVVPQY